MRFPFFRNRDSVKNGILISIRRTGDGFHPGLFNPVQLSAITAGGSQAVFFKINTLGEEAFLDKLIELLDV